MLAMAAAQVVTLIFLTVGTVGEYLSKQVKFIESKESRIMIVLKRLNSKGKSALGTYPSLTV